MSETGEQLNRKWHELNGWRVERATDRVGQWHHLVRPDGSFRYSAIEPDVCWQYLPKLNLDANLAIAELRKLVPNYGFHLGDMHDGVRGCWCVLIKLPSVVASFYKPFCAFNGGKGPHAFCEAILKALIASKESKGVMG